MTTPMGRSVAAAPVGDAKSDKQQAAAERAAIAAVRIPCIVCLLEVVNLTKCRVQVVPRRQECAGRNKGMPSSAQEPCRQCSHAEHQLMPKLSSAQWPCHRGCFGRAASSPDGESAVVVSLQSRELNPHFANGGDGVPPPKPAGSAAAAAAPRPAGVGDGGTSWRLKALRRAQATAAEEGKDVREVRGWDCLGSLWNPGLGPILMEVHSSASHAAAACSACQRKQHL